MVPMATTVMVSDIPAIVPFLIGIAVRMAGGCRLNVRHADLLGRVCDPSYRDREEEGYADKDVEQPVHATRDSTFVRRCQGFPGHRRSNLMDSRSAGTGIGLNALTFDLPVLPTGILPLSAPSGASSKR